MRQYIMPEMEVIAIHTSQLLDGSIGFGTSSANKDGSGVYESLAPMIGDDEDDDY